MTREESGADLDRCKRFASFAFIHYGYVLEVR